MTPEEIERLAIQHQGAYELRWINLHDFATAIEAATIERLSQQIKQQALEYVSLFDQCSEMLEKVAELESQREQAVAELQALIEDSESMRDSLTKEATARLEAEDRIAAIEAATIEKCAKICDSYANGDHCNMADLCADDIRAIAKKEGT